MISQQKTNKAAAPNNHAKQQQQQHPNQHHNNNHHNQNKKPQTKHSSNNNNRSHSNSSTQPLNTPSHIAKSKLQNLYDTLPSEPLSVAARTYASRLHQLRLQRDHRRTTHDRLTSQQQSSLPLEEQTLPSSCVIRFELGASHAVKQLDEYSLLQQRSQTIVQQCQQDLASCIAELQLLEVQTKQEEIRRTFCEGLYKIALSLINHYRESTSTETIKIAESMQSQRLADRLVELLLEQYPSLLEFSELQQQDKQAALVAYYKYMDRPQPTHSAKQNSDQPSSPYNTLHTTFLTDMLDEYKVIVEKCFHTLWVDYQDAVAQQKQQKQQQQQEEEEANKLSIPDSAEKLKELVQSAVSEETQALKATIRNLELQLQQQQQQQQQQEQEVVPTNTEQEQTKTEGTPAAANKKGNQRNGKPATYAAANKTEAVKDNDVAETQQKTPRKRNRKRNKGVNNSVNSNNNGEAPSNNDKGGAPNNNNNNGTTNTVAKEQPDKTPSSPTDTAANKDNSNGITAGKKNNQQSHDKNNSKGQNNNNNNEANSSNNNTNNEGNATKQQEAGGASLFDSYHSTGANKWEE